jgi:hypothetical protein
MFDSYVEIIHKDIYDKQPIFPCICFHLDRARLVKLQKVQANNKLLKFSPSLISNFRYITLVDRQNHLHSGLTFCTYYQQDNYKKAVIRSVIFLDGKINQQICNDLLQSPELTKKLIYAHYSLSEQLLQKLFLTTKPSLNLYLISWGFTLIIAVIFVLLNSQTIQIDIINLLIVILLFVLLSEAIRYLLKLILPWLKLWSLHQLLFGRFSDRAKNSHLVFKILKLTGF